MWDAAHTDDGSVSRLGVALTLRRLLPNCVAASTSRVYGSRLNQYLAFCREVGIPRPSPPPSKSLCWSCLWPSGVRAFPWPPSARTWQGCSISASVSASRRRWRVCILSGLCCAASNAHRPTASPGRLGDAIMLLAAIFSAFLGLLRSAEY